MDRLSIDFLSTASESIQTSTPHKAAALEEKEESRDHSHHQTLVET
jgi:hypothetical protein